MTIQRFILIVVAMQLLAACAPHSARVATGDVLGGGFEDVGDDTVSRYFHRASVLDDGRVMVTGGLGLNIFPSPSLFSRDQISFFDPTSNLVSSSFSPSGGGGPVSPVLATPRSSHTQTTLSDGRVMIAGGRTGASGTSTGSAVSSVELFDPVDGSMTAGDPMSAARSDHTATLLPDGTVVVAGGSTWQVFDPADDSWSIAHPLQRTRAAHAAVLLADYPTAGESRILLVAGSGNGPTTMELLDASTGGSTLLTSTLAIGVDDLAAARLPDGTVLIVGGQNVSTGDTLADTYVLDVALDQLTTVDPPPNRAAGISDHQIVAIGNGVFIFGGEQQVSGADTELDYAAMFDANTLAWTWSGAMNNIHDDFASVVLQDGRVLLIDGGVPLFGQEAPSQNVETFTPTDSRPADINCDGAVNVTDLLAMLAAWGPCDAPCPPLCLADTDSNCSVNVTDLLALLADWG